jgi:hypothetical protein
MGKEPTLNRIEGPTLSEEVYRLALERIEALIGCTEDSSEERELIDWATIADANERPAGIAESDRCGHSSDGALGPAE